MQETNLDNVTQLYAHIKMTSKATRVLAVVTSSAKVTSKRGCRAYYRYRKTQLNLADVFTRQDKLIALGSRIATVIHNPPDPDWRTALRPRDREKTGAQKPEATATLPEAQNVLAEGDRNAGVMKRASAASLPGKTKKHVKRK
ncbi:unnamed protein product [Amoebophrya sp. A25]|nr:unnamed protein product [Amoebophrya sp. A25]|eukprot:GSA25T00000552001.1